MDMRRFRGPSVRWVVILTVALAAAGGTSLAQAAIGRTEAPLSIAPARRAILTPAEALAKSRATGQPVDVTGSTTPTDTLRAQPDGSLVLSRSLLPSRAFVHGGWTALDPTLRWNPDTTASPAVTTDGLRFSGGGGGPLATMTSGGRSFGLSLPVPLPRPVLAGDTATYSDVYPGVDLQVRADRQGGFAEVFVVRDAKAATNPALRSLSLTTHTAGVALSAAADGSIIGLDRAGRTVLAAAAPTMWDSTVGDRPTAPDLRTGRSLDIATGQPSASDARAPGVVARRAAIATRVSGNRLTLDPDPALLAGPGVTYPLYLDPTFAWTPISPGRSAWATVSHSYPGSFFWNNTPDPDGHLQVGNSNEALLPNGIWSRSFLNFAIPVSTLSNATIHSAVLNMTEVWAWSCTASTVNLYAPATTLTAGNASWNSWVGVGLGSVVDSNNVAYGRSGCPAHGVSFNVAGPVASAVAAAKPTQTLVLTGVNESTDFNSYKEFDRNTVAMTVEYNHAPGPPNALTTGPVTSCAASPPTAVGDGAVTLYANVSDPDGNSLGVAYEVWKASTPGTILASSDPNLLTYGSGTTAVFTVPEAILKAAAGTALTDFSWRVRTTDGNATGNWSTTCSFRFDPTRTGAPGVTPPATAMIGQTAAFAVVKAPTGTTPTGYLYQINGGPPGTVAASAGNATVTVTPNRFTNVLTVTGLSAGGNIGDTATVVFNADPAAVSAPDDLTGDGTADLLTVGAANGVPAGLWLASGHGDGSIGATATNIGAYGNGVTGANSPADFNGAQAISGHFTGTGLQDVLIYYPAGANAGGGGVINGNGDGSTLQAQLSGNQHTISAGLLTDINGLNPLRVADAANASGQGLAYPDLIAVNGDVTNGYYLAYYPNQNGLNNYGFPTQLGTLTPAGDTAWDAWTIATTQTATGTAMYLWNSGTGALYLWRDLTYDLGTGVLSFTPFTIRASGWNTGATLSLQSADLNRDGTPDLWTVGPGQAATGHLVTGLGGTPAITAQPMQTLITSTHTWLLNDGMAGTVGVSAATDSTGSLPGSGSGGASWNTGDLFSPDVLFDGSNDTVATVSRATDTNADFTLSVWVKPNATGGVVVSQDGTNTAGFKLWAESTDSSWRFAMPTGDLASPTWNVVAAAAGSVQLGVWTKLTVTYQQFGAFMNLYINDVYAGNGGHPTTWNATGPLRIGAARAGSATFGGYFNGQVANMQVWNQMISLADVGWTSFSNMVAGDFNADGKADLAMVGAPGTAQSRWDGSGGWGFVNRGAYIPDTASFQSWISADLNGDGRADLAAIRSSDGRLVHWNGTGSGFTLVGDYGPGWGAYTELSAADLSGDGKVDLMAVRISDGKLARWWGDNTGFTYVGDVGPGWGAYKDMVAGDINGDGRADLVGVRITDGYLARWTGTSGGGLTYIGDYGPGWNSYRELTIGDFNGDGKRDLVAIRVNDGAPARWNGNGAGGFTYTG
jgi:hypothetical protein